MQVRTHSPGRRKDLLRPTYGSDLASMFGRLPQQAKGVTSMSTIQHYVPQSPSPTLGGRLTRETARALAVVDHATEIRSSVIAAAGEIQQAKVDAIARTGAYAMQQAALVAQVQQQLALTAPAASGDLDVIKTMTVIGIGQAVADTARAVNRR